jgi:hypothetical protein
MTSLCPLSNPMTWVLLSILKMSKPRHRVVNDLKCYLHGQQTVAPHYPSKCICLAAPGLRNPPNSIQSHLSPLFPPQAPEGSYCPSRASRRPDPGCDTAREGESPCKLKTHPGASQQETSKLGQAEWDNDQSQWGVAEQQGTEVCRGEAAPISFLWLADGPL